MHIGLIGGIGPAATTFYYQGLTRAQTSQSPVLQLTIAHAHTYTLLANLSADAVQEQASIFCKHIEQLAAAGADIAAVTSIAGHFCIEALIEISPLPLVNAIAELKAELQRQGLKRIGLLGSTPAMQSDLYGNLSDFDIILPAGADLISVGDEYLKVATAQHATKAQQDYFFDIGESMHKTQSAEAIVLIGTDMFLAFQGSDPGFPVIDSADVHIQSLLRNLDSCPSQ